MFYLIHGTDHYRAQEKFHRLIDSLLKKRPENSFFKLNADNFDLARFEELTLGQTLFDKKYLVACDRLGENEEILAAVVKRLDQVAASANLFVFLEEVLAKDTLKLFSKKAAQVQALDLNKKSAGQSKSYNLFAASDALGARQGRHLWVILQQALRGGFAAEEVFWKLVWQTKNLLLVKQLAGRKPEGMNPYVASKALSYAKNWNLDELKKLSSQLVSLYHDARRGIVDLEIGLERLILELSAP